MNTFTYIIIYLVISAVIGYFAKEIWISFFESLKEELFERDTANPIIRVMLNILMSIIFIIITLLFSIFFILYILSGIWFSRKVLLKNLLKKIGILNLYFSDIEEDGSIICRHCGFSEAVVKEIHTGDEKYFFHLGLQCQSCGKIHYYWSYKSRWGWQSDSICDICGGIVEYDKPIFCPKCKSKNIKYIKLKKNNVFNKMQNKQIRQGIGFPMADEL